MTNQTNQMPNSVTLETEAVKVYKSTTLKMNVTTGLLAALTVGVVALTAYNLYEFLNEEE